VANNFGQGITGRAVSERMIRMKKEEHWNLNTNREVASTPSRKKATPKKKVEDDVLNIDDEEDLVTPSKKKTPLNKVQNGRISKKGSASAINSFNEDIVKDEYETSVNAPENTYEYNLGNYLIQSQALDNGSFDGEDAEA
jgi:hypothetical protein